MATSTLRLGVIYVIRNTVSGRMYVGSSLVHVHRWRRHIKMLRDGMHHSSFLQASWNLHGEAAFVFEIIERVEDRSLLLIREQFWIDQLGAYVADGGLNAARYSDSPSRGRKLTAEHKKKIGDATRGRTASEETKAKIRAWHLGRPRSEATKQKLREAHTGKKMSEDTKQKLREINLGKKMPADAIARTAAFWRGRKHSQAAKDKMRVYRLGRRNPARNNPDQLTLEVL